MEHQLHIRPESQQDFNAIASVTRSAFEASEFGHNGETELVKTIREEVPQSLSLVAEVNNEIVGHIMFSPATIMTEGESRSGMGLAPMAVLPSHQGRGVGSSLVREGLRQLWAGDFAFVIVLGHPNFYPRFGFEPASEYDITHGFDGIPHEFFFIQFRSGGSSRISGGKAFYSNPFGPQHVSN